MPETTPPTPNPFEGRPFFRRVLWRLFSIGGMVNTMPRGITEAQRLMWAVENEVQKGNLSAEALQYLQMVHLHIVGSGIDRLLSAQEQTNRLLAEITDQNRTIIDLLGGGKLPEEDGRLEEGGQPEEGGRPEAEQRPADPTGSARPRAEVPPVATDGQADEDLDIDTAEVERP